MITLYIGYNTSSNEVFWVNDERDTMYPVDIESLSGYDFKGRPAPEVKL